MNRQAVFSISTAALFAGMFLACTESPMGTNGVAITDPDVNMAVYAADANTTDGEWLGVRIDVYDDAVFTTLLQTWTSPAAEQVQAGVATDHVLNAGMTVDSLLMVPALPNTYFLRVQVWETTSGVQGDLLMTGGPNEVLKAQSNLLSPPSVALAMNTTSTVIVPLDWSLGLGNPTLVVETEDGVVFWLGGCVSYGVAGLDPGSVIDGDTGSITITVRDSAGDPTTGTVWATITGDPATGCFYDKVIAPQGTLLVDVEAVTAGPALAFTTFNGVAGGGDDVDPFNVALYPGSTVSLDILTD